MMTSDYRFQGIHKEYITIFSSSSGNIIGTSAVPLVYRINGKETWPLVKEQTNVTTSESLFLKMEALLRA